MEKQCVPRDELLDPDIPPIIFCLSPGDPISEYIRAGLTVTYDLVPGDNGQFYAINVRLAQDEGLAELPNTLTQ
ncbi:hypothetical protein CFN16_25390 [Pseudomonas fluorescens]|uniref:Uncharacterized protein n=1 Tax=Pseudomonas fluorescens TaxID=294 RepID=A0A345V3N9_PSEFL|nr:hypothetical protein [Pseudomonas fluorescens]AXJ07341.1 hypothetical protein CFN16_25390 [Pseudomonas fluorescens]WJK09435.1 hypothetical protein QR290_27090 [Pseudomonas fluorescens]